MNYAPRGYLAKALYDKFHSDTYIENFDYNNWYRLSKPLPDKYQTRFVSLERPDDITLQWLDDAKKKSSNLWLQIFHIVARMILNCFLSKTDINGLLKRGSMYILSETQFSYLLRLGGFQQSNFNNETMIDLLDVGAGDGLVTIRLAKGVIQSGSNIMLKVYATETSYIMKDRLQEKDFTVINNISDVQNIHLISCLNVLDRCYDPDQLLRDIYDALHPNGRVLLALVLPYSHYVEKNSTHLPLSPLLPDWPSKQNQPFEVEAVHFFEKLESMGFRVETWTKAPYLCEGDLRQSFYWLTDILVVLSKA